MAIRPALRNILEVVGSLAHYDVTTNVVDTTVVQHSDSHSSLEVYDCLEELETLGLIKMLQPIGDTKEKKDSETFMLLNITKEGLEKLRQNEKKIK
jgi:small nuclear ribonucleoprotein (snRNP)-like protein